MSQEQTSVFIQLDCIIKDTHNSTFTKNIGIENVVIVQSLICTQGKHVI